jgi:hypothetical protein
MRQNKKIQDAMKESDLVILAGAVCDKFLKFERNLPLKNVISVSLSKNDMLFVSLIPEFTIVFDNNHTFTGSPDKHEILLQNAGNFFSRWSRWFKGTLVIASFVWRRKWKLSHTSSVLRAGFKL